MITRRRFVEGLAATGIAAKALSVRASAMPVLTGSAFDLAIGTLPANITGRPRVATVVNGSMPGPTLSRAIRSSIMGRSRSAVSPIATISVWAMQRSPAEP